MFEARAILIPAANRMITAFLLTAKIIPLSFKALASWPTQEAQVTHP
jgi:hypothetical protein